ncbi:unnamed protein product [Effrenium voratum]|uniref:EF-hand domain-containing protein n=1 Tax=Effrenium voratum TaxID=2562239 RepID=A0AA36I392_9DINO|nr:unnamed protein product [Effrenium voratum]
MCVLNVFLVVVLECAMQTFEADRVQKVSNKELERAAQIEELARQCYNLDASARGRLSVDVLARAYEANGALRVAMDRLQLRQPELEMLCRHLDEENLGEVSYKDLCQHIAGFDRDPLMTQSLVQYSVLDLRRLLLQVLASPRAWEPNWTPSAVPREPTAEAPRAQAPGHGMGPPLRPAAAPTAMGRLEELHAELQPLLGKAEALLSEALDSYRVDVDGPGGALRGDHNARCANLREAFALQRVQTERLEEMLGGVVHRLAQRCGGAEGRTEFL